VTEHVDDKFLKKIAALLEKAEKTDFGPERDALREKAQELMLKWQIDEWQLDEARAARGESRVNKIGTADFVSESDYRYEFLGMLARMAGVMGVRSVYYNYQKSRASREAPGTLKLQLFGYEMDLKYLEMLYATLMLEAASTLEAQPDPSLSFEENIYRLHESAVQWERIRVIMNEAQERGANWRRIPGAYAYTDPDTRKFVPGASDGGVMRKAYRAWCEKIGEEPHTIVNGKRYRRSFVMGFADRIVTRFYDIHQKATSSGTDLVLYDRNRKVADEFEKFYGKLNSISDNDRTGFRMLHEAKKRGADAAERADLHRPGSHMPTKSKIELH
jgi:hypothetical protein